LSGGIADTFLVETPEQLKALSDPLRQRLVELFARGMTIKQAAAALGAKPTRLYHHVDQLLAAGLIRVAREEKVRAVIERTFEAAARRFVVSPSAFGGEGGRAGARERIARAYVEELLAAAEDEEGAIRIMRTRLRLGQAGRERLEREIARLLPELEDPDAPFVELLMLSARQEPSRT
jgi:DNA-binding transcriptional ArsR family regulator